jgi:hypothetical protein
MVVIRGAWAGSSGSLELGGLLWPNLALTDAVSLASFASELDYPREVRFVWVQG